MVANLPLPSPREFGGEFSALAQMIQQSWAQNPNQALLYPEEFLRSAFEYPGTSFKLAPSLYGDAGLIGFVAGFPRSVCWYARPARLVLNSFLTASVNAKGTGIGLTLWADLMERSRKEGYDGTINFCVEGDEMNRMMPVLSRILKLNTRRIFSVEFLSRLLSPVSLEPRAEVSEQDIDLFLELASNIGDKLPLTRRWTRPEAEWQCRGRDGAITVSSCTGGRRGILTGYITKAASSPPTTVALLEDLLWGDLEAAERADLLKRFLRAAAAQGARVASSPVLGYSSKDTLEAARFRRTKRVLHTYLTFWNGYEPRPVPAIYMDVL